MFWSNIYMGGATGLVYRLHPPDIRRSESLLSSKIWFRLAVNLYVQCDSLYCRLRSLGDQTDGITPMILLLWIEGELFAECVFYGSVSRRRCGYYHYCILAGGSKPVLIEYWHSGILSHIRFQATKVKSFGNDITYTNISQSDYILKSDWRGNRDE